ncbi:hypothetical protein L210DRAFT_588959 [Boletus edulis BED1]|uniref:Uncharacterized protein n=1 Tax=Boletus edulis BED1 TaxID=1328754 RepID=A0AAD4C0I9_BOLED|nr:hypothetical protein L210DRAFT_588959 [Boletus edulis BED1]
MLNGSARLSVSVPPRSHCRTGGRPISKIVMALSGLGALGHYGKVSISITIPPDSPRPCRCRQDRDSRPPDGGCETCTVREPEGYAGSCSWKHVSHDEDTLMKVPKSTSYSKNLRLGNGDPPATVSLYWSNITASSVSGLSNGDSNSPVLSTER